MLKSIKTYLEYGNHFCGVEHTVQNDQDVIYTTVLKKSKNDIDIENVLKETSFDSLFDKLPKKQPVFLIINNNNVLTKQIKSPLKEIEKLVYNAFPNINLEDFFYEGITQEDNHFIAICRKVYVKELISKYQTKEFSIINVSLGNSVITNSSNFINSNTICTSNANISIANGSITAIDKIETKELIHYNVNGLEVNNNQLLSFSGALNVVLQSFSPLTNFDLLKQSLKIDYQQSRFFTQFVKFALVFILTSLLINFFIFNHYFNEVNTLEQTSQVNQTTKKKLLDLNESVNKSQKMVDDMLKSSASKSSYFANIIIQGLPNSILLSELNFQPVLKRIKKGQSIEVDSNVILISGASNNSDMFSEWMVDINKLNWVRKTEILSYEDTSKTSSNFSIKLVITND
ncbi:hypothetical protein [Flavivirga jejuensis]|uniref:Uncharacterized protein n=1 Tax=Flavivirga jejuensis TaxID=870487 RepID=A0ABT8WMW8_9FLAO|nr:hypothetical protein [Flavivirga jejuensis]MDO5974503.1 hypothetical protein [Flavivirga jejuensis]